MRIFFCAGEPSGDLHAANLIRSLRQLRPDVECVGYGGEQMQAAGCRVLYPLTQLAVMWFLRALLHIRKFFRLLDEADQFFQRERPDALVLIDYPGFNWHMARRAHARGIPVFYFVPPQLWGWAGWRVKKMQRWVDHVLCTLPFEEQWYHERGVDAHYVGHPYFDELAQQSLDTAFIAAERAKPGTVLSLLPGSREQEIDRNLEMMLKAAAKIHADRPDVRFLVACLREDQRKRVAERVKPLGLPIEVHAGRTPEIIHLGQACIAVSGSVGLELLYQEKPTVVVYRIGRVDLFVCRRFKTSPFISLINLLAGKEIAPEFLTDRCEAEAISQRVLTWLNDAGAYATTRTELAALKERVAVPGACARAAAYVLRELGQSKAIAA